MHQGQQLWLICHMCQILLDYIHVFSDYQVSDRKTVHETPN